MKKINNNKLVSKTDYDSAKKIVIKYENNKSKEKSIEIAKQSANLIGTYWKYKNSYSCPDSEEDYWWLYIEVIGVKENSLEIITYQKDKYDSIEIKQESRPNYGNGIGQDYIQINKSEFEDSKTSVLDQMKW